MFIDKYTIAHYSSESMFDLVWSQDDINPVRVSPFLVCFACPTQAAMLYVSKSVINSSVHHHQ
jgi:hypothetical protein